jgi:hypothetical protein
MSLDGNLLGALMLLRQIERGESPPPAPDFSLVDSVFHEDAEQHWSDGDVEAILCKMPNTRNLAFVVDNCIALKLAGCYETALIHAYSATRTNFFDWDLGVLKFLLELADRAKLKEIAPLPPGDQFTLYRGVAGTGRHRRPSGISWTDDLDRAAWFAKRFPHLADPAIYTTTAKPEDIYWFDDGRTERDFVLYTRKFKRVPLPE